MIEATKLYDYDSFMNASKEVETHFKDAHQGALARESLVATTKGLHLYMPSKMTLLNLGIGVDNSGGYANKIRSLRMVGTGGFVEAGTSSTTQGRIGIDGDYSELLVKGYEAESLYSDTEIGQAQMEKRNLYKELVGVHQRKYIETVDALGYQTLIKTKDFDKQDVGKSWDSMTDEEVYKLLKDGVVAQRSNVSDAYYADTIVLDPKGYTRVHSSDYKANTDLTIAEKLKRDLGVKFQVSFRLKGKTKSTVLILNTGAESLMIRIPQRLKISKVYNLGSKHGFDSGFRVAGVDVLEEGSGFRLENILN